MKKNFWQKLKKPIYALAPMAGVADSAFRQVCKGFGADVVYSEMASVTALVYNPKATLEMLEFSKKERPYVVQLFGSNPEHFAIATKLITKKIKPDGIDINFGCPVKKVQKQGAGAVLMSDLNLAHYVIKSVIENTNLPVSIKCRSAVETLRRNVGASGSRVTVIDLLKKIQNLDVKAIMIHGRTLAQGHVGPVDVKIIKEARKYFKGVILANGYESLNDAKETQKNAKFFKYYNELLKNSGADGVGIAQAALGRPWIFKYLSFNISHLTFEEIKKVALRHAKLAHKLKGNMGILEMRKHLCWYVSGLPNASELRRGLVKVDSLEDIKKILTK